MNKKTFKKISFLALEKEKSKKVEEKLGLAGFEEVLGVLRIWEFVIKAYFLIEVYALGLGLLLGWSCYIFCGTGLPSVLELISLVPI